MTECGKKEDLNEKSQQQPVPGDEEGILFSFSFFLVREYVCN